MNEKFSENYENKNIFKEREGYTLEKFSSEIDLHRHVVFDENDLPENMSLKI